MSKKNNKLSLIFSFLIFFIGASIFFYPTISDLWNKHVNNQLEVKYSDKISKENTVEKDRILNKAIEYNKQHLVNMVKDVFSNNEYSKDNVYYSLLNPNNDGVMGILEIPKINQKLIIWHGVGKEALENGCGHIEGTSLPVGGEGTHAVLASHSGFTNARLFTDLDKLKEDDLFYIQVLDKKLEGDLPFTFSDGFAVKKDKDIYLGLGKQDGKASNKVYKFNVETGKTEELKEIPGEPTRNQAVAQLLGDDIYVFSGGDKIAYTDGYKYSIKDNSWTQVADVKIGSEEISLLGANSVKLNEDEMLVIGGFNKAVYDDAVKNLNTLKDESLAEFKKEYFERDPQDFAWNTKVLIYNSKNNEWKSIGDVPFNAPCGEALILDGDNIFSINGEIKPGIRTNKIYSGELIYKK